MSSIHNFSLSERFEKLCLFLENYIPIWNEEILFRYPDILSLYPSSWVQELEEMKIEDIYHFERSLSADYVKNKDFKNFLNTLNDLVTFSQKEKQRDYKLTAYASIKIKEKKHHEIMSIISCLDQDQLKTTDHIIDLCGGKGLLGQCMRLAYTKTITCYDIDQVLQDTGLNRWSKLHCSDEKLSYIHQDLFKVSELDMEDQSFILGLHTCGALSWQQFAFSHHSQFRAGLNFGCCYHRLLDQGPVLRSSLGKQSRLPMDRAALTLATRGQYETFEDYKFTIKVKSYRYMFHLFLRTHFDIKEFRKLGTSHKSIYHLSFSQYAKQQLSRLNLPYDSKIEKQLQDFWSNQKYQEEMRKMYFANRIRTFLARPVECLLLLDRALFLQEQGFKTQIHTWFDPKISPRNLGISYSRL